MERLSNPDTMLTMFHEKILSVLEKLVPAKKKPSKKSRVKMNRMRRTIWKRHGKVKKKIRSASSIHKLAALIQGKGELEEQLKEDYSAQNDQDEDQAIFNIKANPKSFFSFAKSRQKTKSRIGPFLDPTSGKLNTEVAFTVETLRQQYNSVFSNPRPDWTVSDVDDHFSVGEVQGSR